MRSADAIVVGGGPGGSTAAWQLVRAGLDVLVLDRAAFPRLKLCAGWVTPEAMADLEFEPADYPHSLLTFDRLRLHWKFLSAAPATCQHSIRRYEFDAFLLERSGAGIVRHNVRTVRRDGDGFVLDDAFRCRWLVGAGGTACPVYRALFQDRQPRPGGLQTATLEQEFEYDWQDPDCHLWFFDDGLPGYAWYVPKARGWVNVGLGGIAVQLKERGGHLRQHWQAFVDRLRAQNLVRYDDYAPKGYSYYIRGDGGGVRDGNAFLVGDAAGLATRDLCEGIGPAIRSGLRAARAIVEDAEYTLDDIEYLSGGGFASRLLEKRFTASA